MMKNTKKRLCAALLALMFLLPGLCAAEDGAVTEKDGWHFDAAGFLTGENPGDEYIFEDEENGLWQYASRDLAVTVTRFREKTKKICSKQPAIWPPCLQSLTALKSRCCRY